MGMSYDCASSILLCPEDRNSIQGLEEASSYNSFDQIMEQSCDIIYSDILMRVSLQSEDCIVSLVEREALHIPSKDYVQRLLNGETVRNDALDWIQKVHSENCFGPLSAYLSVNYLDRFLSAYELPQGKEWLAQLLSMACLSLAAKMEESEVPLPTDIQEVDAKYLFEARTIQRMELFVLSTLNWRMQSVTPFSFITYFLYKFGNDTFPKISSLKCSVELILHTIKGIEFLEFRPSEIAAAVAVVALEEHQGIEINKSLSCCDHVDKERVSRCYELIQISTSINNQIYKNARLATSVPQSPSGVLDVVSMNYTSCDTTTFGSDEKSSVQTSPSTKRQKVDRPS